MRRPQLARWGCTVTGTHAHTKIHGVSKFQHLIKEHWQGTNAQGELASSAFSSRVVVCPDGKEQRLANTTMAPSQEETSQS